MLKKAERLNRPNFTLFLKSGKRVHSEYATLIFSPTPTLHTSVVISKKVFKKAVERNLARRRIYALLRTIVKRHNHKGVYIVVLKPSYKQLTKAQSLVEMRNLIERTLKPA